MKRQAVGYVVVLGCALLACKMFKKDEPAPSATTEPVPAPEAAAPEVDATATTTEDASTTVDTPTPANTNTVVVKKDGGTTTKDAGTTVKDAGTTPTPDAGTTPAKDAGTGGTPTKTQCLTLCQTGYAGCLLTMTKKNVTAAKCKSDFDACNAKCK